MRKERNMATSSAVKRKKRKIRKIARPRAHERKHPEPRKRSSKDWTKFTDIPPHVINYEVKEGE
jgi:hypothetical protein